MQKNIVLVALVSLLIGGLGTYAFVGKTAPEQKNGHMMPDGNMMSGSMSSGMKGEMDSMMMGLSGKTGDAFDKTFLSEMIMHHEGAVQMAEAAKVNAKHAEIKMMADAIIAAQAAEIAQMKEWQKEWYGIE